jgi:hypothetical protein
VNQERIEQNIDIDDVERDGVESELQVGDFE